MDIETNSLIKNFARGYFLNPSILDECLQHRDGVKEHWKNLLSNIENIGLEELKSREQELQKLLEENGVTYNIYGDPDGLNRPWVLDTMPMIVPNKEWETIEKGMQQRAYVLNKILEDLYGERRLLKDGIIPPELIYSHSGFLRPCDNVKLPGNHQLFLYAADLSRGPDSKIWVLRDRTQAPSGMGYALENRSALSRVLPEIFNNQQISKLSGFFNTMMQAFQKISPHGKGQPRIVLLTPGPHNETYFEHAFLASYLGLTLVQGEDMLVRNGYVWIKTIEGLEKVDIILRRVDDTFCDPLELREESQLGIPGLLEVIRKGNVVVLNPLGSSILENTGLMAFMHSIFKYFINEDPIFPMVATWWCGQKKELDYVTENLDHLVIKKIDRLVGSETVVGELLTSDQRSDLIQKIKANPNMYVGQEALNISTSPVYANTKIEPRYTVIRSFMVATPDSYAIMPGGLTRCSPEKGKLIVSNQDGGISKDTWVERTASVKNIGPSLLKSQGLRRKAVLPSRAAENLFWVGRYTQRVVRITRFVRIVLRNLIQTDYINQGEEPEALKVMLKAVTHLTGTYPGFLQEEEDNSMINRVIDIQQVICNPKVPGSVVYTINNLLKAMYAVRDKWSVDNWRIIDDVENLKRQLSVLETQNIRQAFYILNQLNLMLNSFIEMNRQSMYREDDWVVYRVGQLIEALGIEMTQYRSLLTTEYDENTENQILEALLVSNQNLTNYRSVYRTYLDIAPTIDLLFLNIKNPISLLSQLEQLLKYLEMLPQRADQDKQSQLPEIAFELYSKMRLSSIEDLTTLDEESGERKKLDALLESLSEQLEGLSNKVTAFYFSHSSYRQQSPKQNFDFEI